MRHRKGNNTLVTFADFTKAYDSMDRNTLLVILRDRDLDSTTHALVGKTLEAITARENTGTRCQIVS